MRRSLPPGWSDKERILYSSGGYALGFVQLLAPCQKSVGAKTPGVLHSSNHLPWVFGRAGLVAGAVWTMPKDSAYKDEVEGKRSAM
jgi:hypothetical protein